ncbi:MAG: hypothetical protein AAGG75_05265 [Bacteroidota bacterium]
MRFFKFSYVLALLAMSCLWHSCAKENVGPQAEAAAAGPIVAPASQQQANPIEVVCGMLSFQNMDIFQSTLTDLETQTDIWEDDFVEANSHMTDEELNLFEEESGYSDEQAMIDFESQYDYQSLRSVLRAQEEVWLDNEVLDEENDPNDHFIIDDYVQTLLNSEEEVMIEGSIYKFLESGAYYEITDGDCQTLAGIKDGSIDPANAPNVIIHIEENMEGIERSEERCQTNKGIKDKITSGSYRIKWKLKIFNYPWQCGAKSKVISYKRKGWPKRWKRHRTTVEACLRATFCDRNHVLDPALGTNGIKCSLRRRRSTHYKVTGPCRSKSGEIKGGHAGNGLLHISTLNF